MEYETTYQDQITAGEAVVSNMEDFIQYNNLDILPNCIDGLKLCQRRILDVLEMDDSRMKGATLSGLVMNKRHPHGDVGIYDAIVRLGQPFSQVYPFVDIKGNFGAYGGGEYAAGRYLDVQYSPFSKDLFFTNVDSRTLTYIPSEIGKGMEPAYLIPRLPTTLLMGAFGVSVAYKAVIPHFNFNSVCNLVEKFIEIRKKYPLDYKTHFADIAEYCIPDFPTHVTIRNKAELVREYSKGNFRATVIMDGLMEVGPTEINLRTVPHGAAFDRVWSKVGEMMNSANFISANFTEINDLTTGTEYGNIQFKFKRGSNPFELLDQLKQVCGFTQPWTPIWTFVDKDGYICQLNPMELLDIWYIARYRSILGALKFKNIDLFKQYRKLSALIVIADHTDEVLKIFKTSENREATVPRLVKSFGLTREQAEYIATLQLHQITHQGKDELLKALQDTKQKIEELQTKFVDIDGIILKDVEELRKSYGNKCQRRSVLPNYIGCVHVRDLNGYIQFSSYQELAHIMKRWNKNDSVEVMMYPAGTHYLIHHNKSGVLMDDEQDLPKEFYADRLEAIKFKPRSAVCLKNGCILRVDSICPFGKRNGIFAHAATGLNVVDGSFKMNVLSTSQLPKRQNLDNLGNKSDIKYFNGVQADEVVIAVVNDKNPNQIVLQRMKDGDVYHRVLVGHNEILGMWRFGDPIAITVPKDYLSRCSIKNVLIRNPEALFNKEQKLTIYMSKHRTSNDKTLSIFAKGVDILTDVSLRGEKANE